MVRTNIYRKAVKVLPTAVELGKKLIAISSVKILHKITQIAGLVMFSWNIFFHKFYLYHKCK